MGIQWADDFSRYGIGAPSGVAMRDGLPYNNWLSICITDPDPLANGRCCAMNNGSSNSPIEENRIALPLPHVGTVGVCARYWIEEFGSGLTVGKQAVAVFATATPTVLACCFVEANGALTIRNGLSGAGIATTTVPIVSTGSWNHIETSYDGTTGDMEVRVNGDPVLTGISTELGTIGFVSVTERIGIGTNSDINIKDLVIWDDTGVTNNTFLGTVICGRSKPNGDVTLGGWTCSTGTSGFALLAKNAVNDTTFMSADDTPPAAMRFSFEDLPPDITSVRALVTVVRARKVDGGDGSLQTSLISGGAADAGTNRPVTTAFTYYFDVSQLDPDTGVPWLPDAVDDVEGEVDRTL